MCYMGVHACCEPLFLCRPAGLWSTHFLSIRVASPPYIGYCWGGDTLVGSAGPHVHFMV